MRAILFKRLEVLGVFCIVFFCVCAHALDYSKAENWVICQKGTPEKYQTFDVFYVYPTIFSDKTKAMMDWTGAKMQQRALAIAWEQTSLFGSVVRVFAPFVRQMELNHGMSVLTSGNYADSEMKTGIDDTADALRMYLREWNNGRPFVVLGHSQGAIDLFYALQKCLDLKVSSTLVAAYLPGLPKMSEADIRKAFQGHGITPSQSADDLAVIVVWNTEAPGTAGTVFTQAGTYGVNPLSWLKNGEFVPATEHIEADFFNIKMLTRTTATHFTGAQLNMVTGGVAVEIPPELLKVYLPLGKGCYHTLDIWLFAGNIRENACRRVKNWKKSHDTL